MNPTSLKIVLSVLLGLLCSSMIEAAYPTHLNVSAAKVPISPGHANSTIQLSVFDAQRNQTVNYTSSTGVFSTPSVVDGTVGWSRNDSQNVTFYFAVYDPKCGCWRVGNSIINSGNVALVLRGGLVGWETQTWALGNPQPNIQHSFAIYNPEIGSWIQDSSYASQRNTGGFITSSTAVAWAEIIYPTGYPTNPPKIMFSFRIYDPSRKQWKGIQTTQYNAAGASYNIVDGTARYNIGGVAYKIGYNSTTGVWVYGADTVPLAYFVASNPTGTAPLKTYFWDMSIGSNSWNWVFGDGGSSSVRSPFYTYQSTGVYTVSQTVTGPTGADIEAGNINVN